jgi:ATP-binding cassette subfamily F protein 2
MPSDAKKKAKELAAKRRAAKSGKRLDKDTDADDVGASLADLEISDRAVTGVLSSHPGGRDIHVENYSLSFHGAMLVEDTRLELNYGRRYGLLGPNGSGKSTFLKSLSSREVEIPGHIDIYHLEREAAATDKSAFDTVVEDVEAERVKLEKEAEAIAADENKVDLLETYYERLDELDPEMAKVRAGQILHGLGFTTQMQRKACKDFSGGWRMRVALAKALFMAPMLLILDDPTNHLDLEACVWLEEFLKTYRRILVLISHSQDFLNGVCTNIIVLEARKLKYYTGNFDTYVKTKKELEEQQMKKYQWEQEQLRAMKEYIARFGHGSAKLAKQAQSKEKTMAKMIEAGLTEKPTQEAMVQFAFPQPDRLPPPVLSFADVAFGYNPGPENLLYEHLDLGVDQDTRVAIVGPNGVGKSTLIKMMTGQLVPTDGIIRRHSHLKLGYFHQHLVDLIDPEMTPLAWMLKTFPEVSDDEIMRRKIGRFGLTGKTQVSVIKNLSDGQKARIAFAYVAMQNAHILLLDEPTNGR